MTQSYQQGNSMVWFDDEIITDPSQALFDAQYWQEQDKVVGSASGRGTTWFVQLDTMQAALRHYRRGGLFGKLVEDHYWFTGWEQTRSLQEFNLLRVLIESGVNVPRPIAARAVKTGLTYQADLLSERIPNAKDLVSILQEKSLSEMMYRKIGQEVAKMHNVNVNHTDLNIHNILIDDEEKVWIIDFDKCYQQPDGDWKQGNLERLKRSFLKELNKCQLHWNLAEFEQLESTYRQLHKWTN
ncbi:3-deoxy-D-manno-octulosonic acid kinase [Vibrio vulnificus]|uniref:3-deoxy-D-manno-octulosonic acid kinase n=1 Tax=Vibrio vulnificus TaxID=672 RepID=UPI001A2CB22F|nr:3-deoxy-D-manno-octulosonic acid kinase [Vibrio vulnificus]ELK8311249.1 3-deoxy-D-manno-octulosonic acid kinase [Vibrio vulnificus]ELL0587138.1 3-deoxy-D-manno-octulosonic acid kinase [Vibrio vulnificus]ELV8710936.1 3-deoxy-D-manno-octulosonic acid kinase [Vibrio vulnificus]MCA3984077.1 3-deoxy-D-manno-octulosonic acid kinase [Vibrio vulnificus]MCU8332999.1 3-deoxy-D-manno-octulosonic acid kinase [Vibrio vulnificus]